MATLKEMRKQRNILKDKFRIEQERNRLQKEIKALKNPKTAIFKKNLKKGLIYGGRKTLKFLDDITKPTILRQPVRKKPVRRKSPKKRRRR